MHARYSIRSATIADIDAIVGLWEHLNAIQRPVRIFKPVADEQAQARAEIRESLEHPNTCTFLAHAEATPVATVAVEVHAKGGMNDDTIATISRLVVHPDYRMVGLATDLIARAERFARERGASHLSAWVYTGNTDAARFWRARGFFPRVEEVVRPILAQ